MLSTPSDPASTLGGVTQPPFQNPEQPPQPGYYPTPLGPPQPPPKRGMSTPAVIALALGIGLASLIAFGAVLAVVAPEPKSSPKADVATTAASPTTAAPTAAAPGTPTTVAPTKPAATTAAAPPPPAAKTSFDDGTYEVGTAADAIAPGKYKTTVPSSSFGCYWERLKGLSGQFSDIIANGTANPGSPVVVTIAASDKGFKTEGCGTWAKA